MARRSSVATAHVAGPKKKRKGIHAKAKTSSLKSSRNYKKKYRGQGK